MEHAEPQENVNYRRIECEPAGGIIQIDPALKILLRKRRRSGTTAT
jgi:hypothetical protein